MGNPSLRVSGHVNSMNRSFIVEDYTEDEFGEWAKDEVTDERDYVDDERSCSWTRSSPTVQFNQGPSAEEKKRKRQGKR